MNLENKVLSDITVFGKYARYMPDLKRRETWDEIIYRNMNMHLGKYPEVVHGLIEEAYKDVLSKKILPSMRSLQFGGKAIERNPARIYNCAYLPVEHPKAFSETMFLLLGGTGVGYSVQRRHVDKLPKVQGPRERSRRYVIGDSIEGWADSVKVLVEAYFYGKAKPNFDYEDIRDKGSDLVTSGGKAPGPEPLRVCLAQIESILNNAIGRQLTTTEVHDIQCFLADAVLAGGIRRAAMISLFSDDDEDMMTAKSGNWWELHHQRARANNSVILLRGFVSNERFQEIWARVQASGAGEPGIYWTNDLDWGTNPCAEIALKPYSFCNLVELNGSNIESKDDYMSRVRNATVIATLQAGYTDFHYLRGIWKITTEEDALIGVGITGIAASKINPSWLEDGANYVKDVNSDVSSLIGINPAARTTTIKPSGTSSLVVGSSSGIHAYHNDYYIRRMRFGKDEALWKYLVSVVPQLCEDEVARPKTMGVLTIPQTSPQGAFVRTESPMDLLSRTLVYNQEWVRKGHRSGANANNVSVTVSIQDHEWEEVGEWMWNNGEFYNGISVLPYNGGTYVQSPFEDITVDKYLELMQYVHDIDLRNVSEGNDNTDLSSEAACAGPDGCEVVF